MDNIYNNEIVVKNTDIEDRFYFITSIAQKQSGHSMFSTLNSRGDLMGGIFDRWINTIPENIIFDKVIIPQIDESGDTKIVIDYYAYDPKESGIAPDVIGIKSKDKVIPFAIFENGWKPVDGMPQIEVKTFKENQKMISLRNQNYDNEYLVMAESSLRIDYLTPFIDPKFYSDVIYENMILNNEVFIVKNDNNKIDKIPKINTSDKSIGTVRLLKISYSNDFMSSSNLCKGTVSPQYLTDISEANTRETTNIPFTEILTKHNNLYRFTNNWYDGFDDDLPYLKGLRSKKYIQTLDIYVDHPENIICIKHNMNNFYIKTTGQVTINDFATLQPNKIYKVTLQTLDRSSNDGEEYFMHKSLVKYINDYSDELINKLKVIINS